jgi:hypothetical protein
MFSVPLGSSSRAVENVLLAFKMSGNCHFQIKWLDNPEYKKMVGCGKL